MGTQNTPSDSAATWTPEHLGVFIQSVLHDRYFALWMLIATTGVRLEALTGLVLQEVDFDEPRISPASARRSCVLDPTAYDALKEHVAAWEVERFLLRQRTQKLFVWSNGEQVDAGAVRTMFRQHCSLADVPVVPIRTMRLAYVVAALESGIPVKQISERLSRVVEPHTLLAPKATSNPAVRRSAAPPSQERAGSSTRETPDCRRRGGPEHPAGRGRARTSGFGAPTSRTTGDAT